MAVEDRPVDEEEPLLAAALARGLPEVGCRSFVDGGKAESLGKIGVPEEIVLDESAAGAEHDDRAVRCHARQFVEELDEVPFEDAAEHRIAVQDAGRSPSLDLLPWSEKVASVDQLRPDTSPLEFLDESREQAIPGERSRAVDGDDPAVLPCECVRQRRVADLDLAIRDRVGGIRVVGHAGERSRRSSVSAALQEKSLTPSGSPLLGS